VFITTTITKWIPVFTDVLIAEKSLRLLERLRAELDARILAYVLMPHHLHAIVKTIQKGHLSALMRKWKSLTARMIVGRSASLHENWLKVFKNSAREFKRQKVETYQIWQPRFDDFAIRTEKQLMTKLNYIHCNPLKHHITEAAEDHPYSSFHDYCGGRNDFISIELWNM
jgi:REP element-mobilizing transposase RayT